MLPLWFGLSAVLILYVYVGFPVLVAVAGKLLRRRVRKSRLEPTISFLIAAHNEQNVISDKLRNCLAQDYPAGKLEVVLASDGSTDGTVSVAREFGSGVRCLDLPRRGKAWALNAAAAAASGEILVFTDANIDLRPDAVRHLAANFADPEVGAVAGHKIYRVRSGSESSSRGEQLYWSYDTWLKRLETLTGSTISADGALYALRRSLFEPLANPAVTDDFAISTGVLLRGLRLVFEPEAVCYEAAVPRADQEFRRKVRLMTRGLNSVIFRRQLLNPFRFGFYSVQLFSHKVLRRLVPFMLIFAWGVSVAGAAHSLWLLAAAVLQSLFYALALLGFGLRRTRLGNWKILSLPFFYCLANLSALLAVFNVLRGSKIEIWNPQRQGTAAK